MAKRARLSNCLFVALYLWYTRGGYVLMRWSKYRVLGCRYPHFLWAPRLPKNMRVIHYTTDTKPRLAPVFRGRLYRRERGEADGWGLLLICLVGFCAGLGYWIAPHWMALQSGCYVTTRW